MNTPQVFAGHNRMVSLSLCTEDGDYSDEDDSDGYYSDNDDSDDDDCSDNDGDDDD